MATYSFPKLTECALCLSKSPLKESHIIPKFFGRELKKKSNSQTLVDGINPQKNPKPQDIAKEYLLCGQCESRFSNWETSFRNKVMPANKSLLVPIGYDDWMLKFAVSISWRVLAYLKYARPYKENEVSSKELITYFPALDKGFHPDAEIALETWGKFLLDPTNVISPYDQYFIVLNGNNFPHENCNLAGFTIYQSDKVVATHAFMGQFIVLGIINQTAPDLWVNTMIKSGSGQIGLQQSIPSTYASWLESYFAEIENVSIADWQRRKKLP